MKRFLFLIIPLLAFSCNTVKNVTDETKVIDFGDGTEFEAIQKYITDISYLPLETPDSVSFSPLIKVLFRDGMIYVGDFINGRICAFDSNGECELGLNSFLNSFTVDDSCIDVMDLVKSKLFRYNKKTGQLAGSLDLTVYAHDIEALGNGDFMFCYAPVQGAGNHFQQSAHRIFITDSELNIKDRMIEYSLFNHDLVGGLCNLSISDDRIVVPAYQDDDFYVFDRQDGRLLEKVHVAFSNPIPETLKSDDSAGSAGYSFIASSPVLCGDYVSFLAKVGDGGGAYEYNFATDTLFSISEHEKGSYLFNIVGCHDGKYVGLITKENCDYDTLVELIGFKKADPDSEAAIRRGVPTLMFYTLK